MKRRRVLAATGLGTTTVVAGYLSRFDAPTARTSADEPDPKPDDPTRVAAGETVERDPGDGTLDADGLRRPHSVTITNASRGTWTTTLAIEQGGEPLLAESFVLEPDATVRVAVTDLATYAVETTVHETDETDRTTVGRPLFDCNATTVSVEIDADGSPSSSTISTALACLNVVTETVPADGRTTHTVPTDVGSDDEPVAAHSLIVTNPTARTWSVRVLVDDGDGPRFDALYALEPGARATVDLVDPGTYAIDVRVHETDATVDRTREVTDDCTADGTQFTLTEAGGLETASMSTVSSCE